MFDVLRALMAADDAPAIPQALMRHLMQITNERINGFEGGWFELLLSELAAEAGISQDRARDLWQSHAYLGESLLFLQLGNPENVWVVDDGDAPF